MPAFSPTPDQKAAIERILQWFKKSEGPYLTMGGYAGTGKTTLIGSFRRLLAAETPELRVAFCAFTGKASQVLARKLKEQDALGEKDSISTIHGLIYEAVLDEEGRIIEWKKRKKLNHDLIVVDEASMVGREIWKDLLNHRLPILAVGDHGQLPPVNDTFSLMADPDIRLEEIHRQAKDSPIIQLSMEVREAGKVPYGSFGPGVAKIRADEFDLEETVSAWSSEETLYLAGKNSTRVALNQRIRHSLGYEAESPARGDRVICLKNNWNKFLFNGQLGILRDIRPHEKDWYQAEIQFDGGRRFSGLICRHQFNQPKTLLEVPGLKSHEFGDLFDFGYALTVHKAQGSQARRAVVFEERMTRDEELWRRWLYTAVTRAEEELLIVGY